MKQPDHAGQCLCGAVRYRVTAPVRNPCYCHCESCRRATGGAFVAWGTVDQSCFHLVEGTLALHRSSPEVERGFCAACGTALTYQHTGRSDEIDFTLVSLDDPSPWPPAAHIWLQDRLPRLRLDDDLPRYNTVPGH